MNKPRIFSGIQPSGNLHIGNYLGAISQWVKLQNKYNCIFCVVDYHAITVKQNPEELRKKIFEIAKLYIAGGVDPKKSIIFQQSRVGAHTELAWILNCIGVRKSDLNKMTQFKDKAGEKQENVSVGLYDYPALMAADILLYNTEAVPVGDDQLQHVELTRTIARRVNKQYGQIFTEPKPMIGKEGARIMGLDNPAKKMSKSAPSDNNRINLLDDPALAEKKIMRAVTDAGTEVKVDSKKKSGISNLLIINSLFSGKSTKELEEEFKDKGYGDFKKDTAKVVVQFLTNFQSNYNKISDNEVRKILDNGAREIKPIAERTLQKVKDRIGVN